MNRFDGRTALITGAAGDIGRAVAQRLAAEGAALVLADVGGDLDATVAACRAAAPTAHVELIRFDVTDADAVRSAFADVSERGVEPDLLFNNAGYQGHFAPVIDYELEDFQKVLDVNVAGVFTVLQAFCRSLVVRGRHGAVVNTASMAHTGAPNMVAYSASKAAVIALTKTAAKDLAAHSIRVNSISPAFIGPGQMWDRQVQLQADVPSQYFDDDPEIVAKQMIGSVPMRRYGTLDEVASVVCFLLSDDASYITAFDIEVSGGAS